MLVAALGTQLVAVRTLVGGWWSPRAAAGTWAELTGALGGIGRWSPVPAGVTYAPFVLAVLLALVALAAALPAALPAARPLSPGRPARTTPGAPLRSPPR